MGGIGSGVGRSAGTGGRIGAGAGVEAGAGAGSGSGVGTGNGAGVDVGETQAMGLEMITRVNITSTNLLRTVISITDIMLISNVIVNRGTGELH